MQIIGIIRRIDDAGEGVAGEGPEGRQGVCVNENPHLWVGGTTARQGECKRECGGGGEGVRGSSISQPHCDTFGNFPAVTTPTKCVINSTHTH